jgi:heme/copper-type cytochrome/quinol oxidase subunit 3
MELLAFNTTLYKSILFLHVFSAIVWVGGAFYFQVKISQFSRTNDMEGFLRLGREAEQLGMRLFMPMSIVVLLAGIAMVWYGPYGFELWIGLALIGMVVTVLTGALFLSPQGGAFATMAQERGFDDPEVVAGRDRLILVARLDYAVLVLIVLDMVFKPGL